MEVTNLNVRVDKEVKANAEAIAAALGMNLSTAVNIFEGIPFSGPFHSTEALMEALNSRSPREERG